MPDNPADQKAEEARREAHREADCCSPSTNAHPSGVNPHPDDHPRHAAIDRYGLLARLAQAERMIAIATESERWSEAMEQERDRLRREVEEMEKQ